MSELSCFQPHFCDEQTHTHTRARRRSQDGQDTLILYAHKCTRPATSTFEEKNVNVGSSKTKLAGSFVQDSTFKILRSRF